MAREVAFFNAKLIDGTEIYIEDARSGANGYYCIDCNSEMIAVIGEGLRQAHFRHHPKDVSIYQECTWSNESYRHKAAKEILQRIKEIRVPAVVIPRPKEFGGGLVEIKPSELVRAHSVLIERFLYEDAQGYIWAGRTDEGASEKSLAVKPDVVFLDAANRPILLIEIFSTNKVDNLKLLKYEKLGINAIEIHIPKAHKPEDIEASFYYVTNTKWLYNEDAAKTAFNPNLHRVSQQGNTPTSRSGKVPRNEPIDCRAFRVRDAIRSTIRFMGGSEFGDRKQELGRESAEIEAARENVERDTAAENNSKRLLQSSIESQEAEIDRATAETEFGYSELERRYTSKRAKLVKERNLLDREEVGIADEEDRISKDIKRVRGRCFEQHKEAKDRVSAEEAEFIRNLAAEEAEIAKCLRDLGAEVDSFEDSESREIARIDSERKRIELQINAEERLIRKEESELQDQEDELAEISREIQRIYGAIETAKRDATRAEELETKLRNLIERDTK